VQAKVVGFDAEARPPLLTPHLDVLQRGIVAQTVEHVSECRAVAVEEDSAVVLLTARNAPLRK